ncbi:hypothetical protein Taro_017286 [Colocasia esculenta]|uniref:Uncharacterized protein n=1 Tax=Colocasia esculenta TaxID=4460 RepID=A0A843UQT9_COLES|nr:hypothetical protein [Colocasia esculenta]
MMDGSMGAGKLSLTWWGCSPRVIVVDPVLVREILNYKSGHFERPTSPVSGLYVTGLLATQGEKWAMHRRILAPAFHMEKLKLMWPAFSACCTELVSRWEKLLGPDGSCELDVRPEFRELSRDVISRTAFGSSFEEGRRVVQLQEEQALLVIQSFKLWEIPGYRVRVRLRVF